ncbi:MAG: hypothetical protein JOZ16_04050 [Methylobacteriaceae bacterium]|nr:hypothetical protein [Methylobacteriaceae bacterium]
MTKVQLGMWGWGFALLIFCGLLLFILGSAFPCIDPGRAKDGTIILGTPDCRQSWASRAYLIVYDMQTGIGAAIAVLGVVWSVFFRNGGEGE